MCLLRTQGFNSFNPVTLTEVDLWLTRTGMVMSKTELRILLELTLVCAECEREIAKAELAKTKEPT